MLVQNNIIPLLDILFCRLSSSGDIACALHARKFIAMSVRSLTASQGAINKLVGDGAIRLVCNIMCAGKIQIQMFMRTVQYHYIRLLKHSTTMMYCWSKGLLKAISRLAQHPECFGIAASILYLLSSDPQHRELVVLDSVHATCFLPLRTKSNPLQISHPVLRSDLILSVAVCGRIP